MMRMAAPSFARDFLRLFSGPIIWAVHFLSIYGFTGVLCARPPLQEAAWMGISIFAWGIGAATILAIAAVAFLHFRDWRAGLTSRRSDFLHLTASGLGILSIVAIIWETVPVFIVPPCG
jgi:hypothetical protein